jgi:hypothetical protein
MLFMQPTVEFEVYVQRPSGRWFGVVRRAGEQVFMTSANNPGDDGKGEVLKRLRTYALEQIKYFQNINVMLAREQVKDIGAMMAKEQDK